MKKRLVSFFNNIPFKTKIMTIILIVNIGLTCFLSILGIKFISDEYNKLLYSSMSNSLSNSANEIEQILMNTEKISNLILTDVKVQDNLAEAKSTANQLTINRTYKTLHNVIENYYSGYKDTSFIKYISIYSDKFVIQTISQNSQSNKISEDIKQNIIVNSKKYEGAPIWITEYGLDNNLFLAREIREVKDLSLDRLGTLVICIDLNKLITSATNLNDQYDQTHYLLYDSDKLIYSSNNLLESDYKNIQNDLKEPYGVVRVNNNYFFASRGLIPNYNFSYRHLVSYNNIQQTIMFTFILYIVLMIILIFLASFLANKLISRILIHLNTLLSKIKAFRGENSDIIDVGYNYDNRQDELGLLHQYFDSMAIEIKDLINENYKKEILTKESQISALQAQINPHFLYNVLESINWRAKAIGEKDISLIVESLGGLLRTILNDKKYVTIEEELNIVQLYMNIQQLRYDDMLKYEVSADETILNHNIPKLTIQPLVENAIKYGLENSIETCHINIIISLENTNINIRVMNTGSYFEEDLLEKLYQKTAKTKGLGLGLTNINDRIKLIFGESYGVTLYNENDYAVAMITIPDS